MYTGYWQHCQNLSWHKTPKNEQMQGSLIAPPILPDTKQIIFMTI